MNIYENTTLVILGDHGESLFEDGFLGHGHTINDYQTQIPLVTNDPEMKSDRAIGQTDVAELLKDKKYKPWVEALVRHWNSLRWREHQARLLH